MLNFIYLHLILDEKVGAADVIILTDSGDGRGVDYTSNASQY